MPCPDDKPARSTHRATHEEESVIPKLSEGSAFSFSAVLDTVRFFILRERRAAVPRAVRVGGVLTPEAASNASNLKIPERDSAHAPRTHRNSRTQHNNHSRQPRPAISTPH
jgi:hypothetical protein